MDVKNDLGRFLRDLWDEVVSPIVDLLQTTVPPRSRIWWCPTAEFSLLPLHAAGPYRRGQQNLSHLYISSYTPTLTALIRARRNPLLTKSSISENHFLAVGQATGNGQSKLLSVGSELGIVAECMQGLVTLTRLEGSESTVSRVSEELRKNEWVHFARRHRGGDIDLRSRIAAFPCERSCGDRGDWDDGDDDRVRFADYDSIPADPAINTVKTRIPRNDRLLVLHHLSLAPSARRRDTHIVDTSWFYLFRLPHLLPPGLAHIEAGTTPLVYLPRRHVR
jgi:hypothetical protein